ncbi:hypothetical protein GGQ80_000785 [Sphingomonas jinjuensis]|uniref:DUF6950 domain-containing protein n=1 Tax=Sphingomonas jinjuensis TaxID=535907 RepID=A0A840FBI3_9SPHN|nr:hypothetical protein [Sphingomonas jinjuensis]MBB4152897.1 hypothetical protein [Sphingomonas jinjuensis]
MIRDLDALGRLLAARLAVPFAWGRDANDCVGLVLAAIAAQTGRDALPGVAWASEREAAVVIGRLGGLERALDERLRRIAPALAARGDVAGIADARFGVSLMLVEGATLVGPGPRGLKRLPRSAAIAAWSILPG